MNEWPRPIKNRNFYNNKSLDIEEHLKDLKQEFDDLNYLMIILRLFEIQFKGFLHVRMFHPLSITIYYKLNYKKMGRKLDEFLKYNSHYHFYDDTRLNRICFGPEYRDITKYHYRPLADLLENYRYKEYVKYGC